jgi:hypothetical protein
VLPCLGPNIPMTPTGMLSEGAHAHFTEVLSAWGTANVDIEDTLRWATFCPCVVELISDDPELPPCVGIVIDETQDEDLARLFALRERLDDDEFFANWEVSPNRAARIVLDPESPQALFRYAITVERPERIERRFLFIVHTLVQRLAAFQRPGTEMLLIPERIAAIALGVPTNAYEVISHCLPVGAVTAPLATLDQALTHVTRGA